MLLELAARRLPEPEREDGEERDRDAEHQEGHRQPSVAAGQLAIPATITGLSVADDAGTHRHRCTDAPADRRSGRHRRSSTLHRRLDFATPTPSRVQKS